MNRNLVPSRFLRTNLFRLPDIFEEMEEFPTTSGDTGLTISEDKENVYIEASMPGLNNDEINVTIDQGVIFIQGEKTEEENDNDKKFHRKATSSFSYRIAIPGQVDEGKDPEAKYEKGILKLTFTKSVKAQSKRITVK